MAVSVLLLVVVVKSRVLTSQQVNAQQSFSKQSISKQTNGQQSIAQQSNALQTSAPELARESNSDNGSKSSNVINVSDSSNVINVSDSNKSVSNTDFSYLFLGEGGSPIHPAIIKNLNCWLSDTGDQVVSVNLLESQGSNRYFGEVELGEGDQPWRSYYPNDIYSSWFGYKFIGRTESGVYVLQTAENTGGSGVFTDLVYVHFSVDVGLQIDWDAGTIEPTKERLLITKLGESSLGDRWSGELRIEGNKLFVGRDEGWFTVSGGTGGNWLSYDLQDRVLVFTDPAN